MLHNIDDHRSIASVRVAEWKLSRGSSSGGQWDSWYGPSGRDPGLAYDVGAGSSAQLAILTMFCRYEYWKNILSQSCTGRSICSDS